MFAFEEHCGTLRVHVNNIENAKYTHALTMTATS